MRFTTLIFTQTKTIIIEEGEVNKRTKDCHHNSVVVIIIIVLVLVVVHYHHCQEKTLY